MAGSMTLRAEEKKPGSSSWIVDMEGKFEDTNRSVEMVRWKKTSIYRIPNWLKDITNSKAYRPQMVSLGPFHHGEADLLPMEVHKRRAMLHLAMRSGKPLGDLVAAVKEVAYDLDDAYSELGDEWRGENRYRFVDMMVMDGCFLLELIRANDLILTTASLIDYPPNDPVFSLKGLLSSISVLRSDMTVMENQLPLLVLQKLLDVQDGVCPISQTVNNMVTRFLGQPKVKGYDSLCLHPLDAIHKGICGPRADIQVEQQEWVRTMPSAVELSEAGIHFKLSDTQSVLDIDFQNGVLRMPLVNVREATENKFLNLMAFERLHGDAGNAVIDFIVFMDNMIDSGADVALLRSKGLIEVMLGSDEAVAQMFNNMTKGAVLSPTTKVHDVQRKVNAHCKKRWNKLRASFVHTYLSNPWVFISLLAAAILLAATLMQTVYTVITYYKKS